MTELVGRQREISELRAVFDKVKSGEAQIVDVVGEAGIGKSRLAYEFRESLGKEAKFLTGLCMQYGGNINFLPVIDIVKAAFGIEQKMSEEDVGKRIEAKAKGNLSSMISFYRRLLSLKVDDPKFNTLPAHHYSMSGNAEKAIKYLIFAGEKSNEQNAIMVALQFFERALKLVKSNNIEISEETEVQLHYGLALANNGLGDTIEAVRTARIAVHLSRKYGI